MSVWTTAGLIADGSFDDPENARIIYLVAGGLVLLGGLLGVGTWMWWRSAKVEHPALAPLEVMSSRRWWKGDFNERRRRLDEVRPTHVDDDADAAEPPVHVDLEQVMVREDPHHFDDLVEPVVGEDAAVVADPESDSEPEPELSTEPEPEPEPELSTEPEPEPELSTVPEPEPEPGLTFEPVAAAPRSVVIDTSPRPRDTPSDLGPESVDQDPTPDPIDPLLRIQAE